MHCLGAHRRATRTNFLRINHHWTISAGKSAFGKLGPTTDRGVGLRGLGV